MRIRNNRIIYPDNLTGIYKKALEVLSAIIVEQVVEYPACVKVSDYSENGDFRDFFIGTKENNPYIKEFSKAQLTKNQEYAISVTDDRIIIEGYDDVGVLYGCVDFYGKYLVPKSRSYTSGPYIVKVFENKLKEAFITSAPAAQNRGFWTWGHVIYDWRGYIDNMLKLKLNTLIIWNDFPPINAREVISYAHDAGIKIIWGFPWLWDTDCNKVDLDNLSKVSDEIVKYYKENYADLGGDGIYFQSFTELDTEKIGGKVIAEVVTEFVNDTAGKLFEKYPKLELQFGLHANSVKNRLEFIKNVDERISIIWENCGCFPFSYIPETEIKEPITPEMEIAEGFENTKAFVNKITNLRGEKERFGVVVKGLTKLDWKNFQHQSGPFALGCATKKFKENRIERKKRIWHYIQAGWISESDSIREIINLMIENTKGNIILTALLEDGMFEDKLYYPVILLSEMMWDNKTPLKEIEKLALMRSDAEFV